MHNLELASTSSALQHKLLAAGLADRDTTRYRLCHAMHSKYVAAQLISNTRVLMPHTD